MLRIVITAMLILSLAAVAAADVTVVQKVETTEKDIDPKKENKTELVQTMMFKGKKVRINIKDQKSYSLVDIEKGILYLVNPEKKTYSKITFEDLKVWRVAILFEIQQRLNLLELLPPEMKQNYEIDHAAKLKSCREDLAKKDKETKVEVKKLDEEKEIGSHKCRHIVIEEEGKAVVDLWMTDKVAVKADLSEILGKVAPFSEPVKKAIKSLKGFSLKTTYTISIGGWTYTNSAEANEVKTGELDKKKFDLPEDYTEVGDTTPMFKPIRFYKQWKKVQKKEENGKKETGEKKENGEKKPPEEDTEKPQSPQKEQPEKEDTPKKGGG